MSDLEMTRAEQAWLEQRRLDAERAAAAAAQERPRRLPGRMSSACDRWSLEAGWVAAGLEGATVTDPPSAGEQVRRGSSVSDPTGAALYSTLSQVESAAVQFAHLAGPCRLDGTRDETGRLHECPDINAQAVASWLGFDAGHAGVVDDLMGVSASSTVAFRQAVSAMAAWHTLTASRMAGAWRESWQLGVENSVLDSIVSRTEELQRRMAALAGHLADWSGRSERRCRCGGGLKPGEGTCGRCRTAAWRERESA